eukprot:s225_g41.t1
MGALSSAKKRVNQAAEAQEFGAEIDGSDVYLGPSAERLVKLLQTTFVVLSKRVLRKKWLQVVAGRWAHILSFRRPGMIMFDSLWKFVSSSCYNASLEMRARSELFGACLSAAG